MLSGTDLGVVAAVEYPARVEARLLRIDGADELAGEEEANGEQRPLIVVVRSCNVNYRAADSSNWWPTLEFDGAEAVDGVCLAVVGQCGDSEVDLARRSLGCIAAGRVDRGKDRERGVVGAVKSHEPVDVDGRRLGHIVIALALVIAERSRCVVVLHAAVSCERGVSEGHRDVGCGGVLGGESAGMGRAGALGEREMLRRRVAFFAWLLLRSLFRSQSVAERRHTPAPPALPPTPDSSSVCTISACTPLLPYLPVEGRMHACFARVQSVSRSVLFYLTELTKAVDMSHKRPSLENTLDKVTDSHLDHDDWGSFQLLQ